MKTWMMKMMSQMMDLIMNSESKKVIITGISGQVGSYMAEYCLNLGHKVYGVVRRTSTPNNANFKHLIRNPNFTLLQADLTDGGSIEEIVKSTLPDYFINLGAQSFVGVSWKIPEETFNVDTLGVIRCLEAIRKNVPECRFYNAGSSEQFGNVDYSPQDEKHPFKPRSPYGAAKCAAHHIIKVYRESYNLYAVQGLLFNHESERRGEEFVTRKITLGVARILDELNNGVTVVPIELGNVDAKRDWSHAEDFVDGIWRMLNQEIYRDDMQNLKRGRLLLPGESWKIVQSELVKNIKDYVLASGETHSIREFSTLAFYEAGIDAYWSHSDKPTDEVLVTTKGGKFVTLIKINPQFYRPAEVEILLGSSELVKKELGWSPKVSFINLVERMVSNDLKNPL